MYCKNCGKNIEENSKFCKNCGYKIETKKNKLIIFVIIGILLISLVSGSAIFLGKKIASYIETELEQEKSNIPNITDDYYNHNNDDYNNYFYDNDHNHENNNDNYNNNQTSNYFNNITATDFLEIKKSSIPTLIFIGSESDNQCFQQAKYLYLVAERYNLKINFLELENITDEEMTILKENDNFFNTKFLIPTLLIVKDNQIIETKEGVQDLNAITELFSNYHLID